MKGFINKNFLLQNKTAKILYHNYAKRLPIIDYHSHLEVNEIAEDRKYKTLTDLWLSRDHYKWRAMRINGIDERYITGKTTAWDKFFKWSQTIPYCIGNPIYHWTHLELKRYFGIDLLLSPSNAEEVWKKCNAKLKLEDYSSRELIKRYNIKVICTTNDPIDVLKYHSIIAKDESFKVKVLPTMRNDMCIDISNKGFGRWLERLIDSSNKTIKDLDDFKNVIIERIEYFNKNGCRISDHSFESINFIQAKELEIKHIFNKKLETKTLNKEDIDKFKTHMMIFLGRQYYRLGWTMQLRIGALRNNNSRMFKLLGSDTGFDSISDLVFAKSLVKLLNALEEMHQLPKTIVYCLNPGFNEVIGSIIGCFNQKGIHSKIQFGPAWWFNDYKDGMEKQMIVLANFSLFSSFIGMTTDSRSLLSFSRHEYFRRILCNLIGKWAEDGEVPKDIEILGDIINKICFNNAKEYFKL